MLSIAQPSSKAIDEILTREKNGSIHDCFYINELFKTCETVAQTQKLSKLLESEFTTSLQKKRTVIATARRLSFLGEHRQALRLLQKFRKYPTKDFSNAPQSEYYNAIGYIAINSGNPEIALKYYRKSVEHSRKTGNTELLQSHLSSVGVAYNALNRADKALSYFEKALSLETKGENRNSLYIRLNLALTHMNLGQLEKAKNVFLNALPIIRAKKDSFAEIRTLGNLGDIYLEQDSTALALLYYQNAQRLALVHNQSLDLIRINSGLSNVYEKLGDYQKALQLLQEVHRINDTLNTHVSSALTALELQQEIDGKDQKNALLSKERDAEKHLKQWLFAALIILLLILILLLIYIKRYQNKKRHLVQREVVSSKKITPNNPDKYNDIIVALEEMMETKARYNEPGLTLDQLAREIGTNRSYLSEAINSQYEMNFTQWITNIRIKEAKRLLMDKTMNHISIEGIANSAGFASTSTFNAHFKKNTGLTPSYFRSHAKKH